MRMDRSDLLGLVVLHGLMPTAVGMALGVAGSLGLARFFKTLLFGVSATSPWVFATVAGVLVVVACLASVVPTRRALRVDPLVALRCE